ncbi:MAG: S9 family peptidase, partial [Bacteroidetes bacterium]|nr:S9 family peptidase [Bacteroidota bacterium]
MKKLNLFFVLSILCGLGFAQAPMSPELLQSLGRVSALGITVDGKSVIYKVSTPDVEENKFKSELYILPISGGEASKLDSVGSLLKDKNLSPDGKLVLEERAVKLAKVAGSEVYPDMNASNVKIYGSLDYRHWDTWRDGNYRHVFVVEKSGTKATDLIGNEPYDCPQLPFGGDEDYIWNNDGSKVIYVCKKKAGTEYAISTNTDLYEYDLASGSTVNLTESNKGYDMSPMFSSTGTLAWLSMARDGYESDKNDIKVMGPAGEMNLTAKWDGTVSSFIWNPNGKEIFFTAPVDGTKQLFVVDYPGKTKKLPVVKQLTKGDFDISGIVGQSGEMLILNKMDMNHASEIYSYNLKSGELKQLSHANDDKYAKVSMSKIERRYVKTTDGKDMMVWVIFPPDFRADKKYPTLLYCQGGPQSEVSQFYSFRWNFQLMAARGYIVVAPNRRGLPGFGVRWNEAISKDWGGQSMRDYLSAIDAVSAESYVDKSRLGCIGASYGGYSVYNLAGIHEGRFKTFIAHAGVFNLKSMYNTTEEVFFTNFDIGGPYWDAQNAAAQKSYKEFDPSSKVDKWNTPMLILHGGKDFRVPEGQGFEAFQVLQLKGIKSKLVYFPEENHWILRPQNGI